MRMVGPINSGAAVGGNGVATANYTSTLPMCGVVYGFYVRYNDSPPAGTTDVTIASAGTNMPAITYLTITNGATDGLFLVRKPVVDAANAAIASLSIAEAMPIDDYLKVTIAQANAADSADVWVFLE